MAKFSNTSKQKLETCHEDLQLIINEAIKDYDFSVLCGYRSNEEQDKLYKKGVSKVKAGGSKHNLSPSLAVDIAPYPIDWNDKNRFYYLAGIINRIASENNIAIRWGGDWNGDGNFKNQTFHDLPHFEIKS